MKSNGRNICHRYNIESNIKRKVYKSPYSHLNTYPKDAVSLIVSLTLSRFSVFEWVIEYWSGPVSVSLYMDCNTDFEKAFSRIYKWLSHDALDIHIVLGGVKVRLFSPTKGKRCIP